ncbi:MAG TPA: ribosome recycling factor [Candidatus Saccharimonadales bacterium]|nr:ribosome recycling factor [Candidatus Saccharimonadales bacterium]
MSPNQIFDEVKKKIDSAVEHLQNELKKLRTGRAHPSMLDGVMVEAYGSQMPLNQTATVIAPESQLLQITPFDPNNLQAIAAAIRNNQTLGLNPTDDGRVVRVPIPPLTEERRRDLAKQIGEKVEDAMISMRNARHDALKAADAAKKDKSLSEDDVKRVEKQVDDLMAQQKQTVDKIAKDKEAELLTI